jgi:RNA polymerase sigma-70 factor, ECF subfamily
MAAGGSALKARRTDTAERDVIEAAQKDPSRFADLYEGNFDIVYAFIARRVRDRDHAQDLTADVFHQALANLPRFEWRGVPFAAWLLRIAANAVADHFKRIAKEREAPQLDDPGEASIGGGNLEDFEQRARLFQLVNDLPADQRRVVIMRFAEQRTIREIADALRRSEGAVKQLQFRGLENLRMRMGEKNG